MIQLMIDHLERPVLAAALAALALLACGCPEVISQPPRDLSKLHADEAARLFTEEERAVQTLNAGAVARFYTPDKEPPPVDAVVLIRRPDLFRMQAFPRPIGPMIFDVSIAGDTVKFYVRDENTLYIEKMGRPRKAPDPGRKSKGPDLDAIFGRTGMASMFLGTPVESGQELRFVERGDDGLKMAIIDSGGLVTGYAWLDPVTLFKRKQVVFGQGGKVSLSLSFAGHREVGKTGLFWPKLISIDAPEDGFRLTLDFDLDDVVLNEPIPRENFEMQPPDDVKLRERS